MTWIENYINELDRVPVSEGFVDHMKKVFEASGYRIVPHIIQRPSWFMIRLWTKDGAQAMSYLVGNRDFEQRKDNGKEIITNGKVEIYISSEQWRDVLVVQPAREKFLIGNEELQEFYRDAEAIYQELRQEGMLKF